MDGATWPSQRDRRWRVSLTTQAGRQTQLQVQADRHYGYHGYRGYLRYNRQGNGKDMFSGKCLNTECQVLPAVTMKDAVFWDKATEFVPHREHITSPL
jgi:hypothetical protein